MSGGRFVVVLEQEQAEKLKERVREESWKNPSLGKVICDLIDALTAEKRVYSEPPQAERTAKVE